MADMRHSASWLLHYRTNDTCQQHSPGPCQLLEHEHIRHVTRDTYLVLMGWTYTYGLGKSTSDWSHWHLALVGTRRACFFCQFKIRTGGSSPFGADMWECTAIASNLPGHNPFHLWL